MGCYRQALQFKRDSIPALVSLASVLAHQGKPDEAITCYREALRLKPDNAEIHHHLGAALCSRGDWEEAIICQRHALEFRPDYADAHADLGNALSDQFKTDEALIAYETAARISPAAGARIQAAIVVPAIYAALADLHDWREQLGPQLASLHEEHLTLDITKEKALFPFHLAYQGMNDRDLNRQIAKLYVAPRDDRSRGRFIPRGNKQDCEGRSVTRQNPNRIHLQPL